MSKMKRLKAIFKTINTHPLAGKHRIKAFGKFIYWQLINFVDPKERKVKFLNNTYLLAKKSMKGATGNIYLGLHEFSEMGFMLHFLRKGDMFFDIGANIGSYTILAAGEVGAHAIAFEPIPSTYNALKNNLKINKINTLVEALNVGVGAKAGTLIFSEAYDTVNHVIPLSERSSTKNGLEVAVVAIDEIVINNKIPILIKIDVEGFETEVLNGMNSILNNYFLKGIIIELNGSGKRYGYDESLIHQKLISFGFSPFEYDPFNRKLTIINEHGKFNTLYLRDNLFIKERILSADKIEVFSELL